MRYFKLVTIERRGGVSFQLKTDAGRMVIGTMIINPGKARHEMELSEPDYLKHAKAIALLCRTSGAAVYVESIRDDSIPVVGVRFLPDTTRYHLLTKIARDEDIDISSCETNKARIDTINTATANRAVTSAALAKAA